MAEHMNALQVLIHQNTSLEVPLANEVLALLLLRSLPGSWETLVVTLGNAGPEGKHLSLAIVERKSIRFVLLGHNQVVRLNIENRNVGEYTEY